jgi:hypothetical protein
VADARGNAYVLVGDLHDVGPSHVAVVDIVAGTVRRHLPLAVAGERVFSLAVHPNGRRLYAGIWRWGTSTATGARPGLAGGSAPGTPGAAGGPSGPGLPLTWRLSAARSGSGRLVALDARTGELRARAGLPDGAAITNLVLAAPPWSTGPAKPLPTRTAQDPSRPDTLSLYATVTSPGPTRGDAGELWAPALRSTLFAFEARGLNLAAAWPLEARPVALAVPRSAKRAYVLDAPAPDNGRTRRLLSLDLTAGRVAQRWSVPAGCGALSMGPGGRLYAADADGDRLWRVDTSTDTFLGSVTLAGAPVAVAAAM